MDLQLPKKPSVVNFAAPGSKMQHTIFEAVLLIIVAVVFYMFMIQPKRADLASSQSHLDELTQQKNSIQSNKNTLSDLINKLQNSPDKVAELDEALPLSEKITRYRITLESLVGSSGMKVGDISTEYADGGLVAGDRATLKDPFSKTRKLQKFTSTINLSGTFDQFTALLKKLENNGRIIDIQGISISGGAEDTVEFRLTTQSYYYE